MNRQALGQTVRTVARRVGLGLLFGIAGAFAVTLLSWLASSMAASAEEEPAAPLVNVVDTGDALGLVNGTVHDTVHGTVDTVTTKVLRPESKVSTSARPLLAGSLGQTLGHADKTVDLLIPKTPTPRPFRGIAAVQTTDAPVGVPSPPPDKHEIYPPVRRPPVPVQASVPMHNAVGDPQEQPAPKHNEPQGPRAPGSQWDVPVAPAAPSGSAGSGFHSPDTPAFEGGSSSLRTGGTVQRPLRSTGALVIRTVNAQPGVTPD